MSLTSRKYHQQPQHDRLDLVPEEEEEEGGGGDNQLDGTGSRRSSLDSQDSRFLTGDGWARQDTFPFKYWSHTEFGIKSISFIPTQLDLIPG